MTPPKSRAARIAPYAAAFAESDLTRLALSDGEFSFEFIRRAASGRPKKAAPPVPAAAAPAPPTAPAARRDTLRAEMVGVIRFVDPRPHAGLEIEHDRQLFALEALGVKNPVRSNGKGRIVDVLVADGAPVEYGQPLAVIERV